ncbi:uncharacterized protein LOC111359616 [Spodoptera litura]|uniref:Uncharacterized protein LOC111359616 n=1 Tax=Spodoptera litura TaxID=69820 RepID=A0A9J7EI89_SPOLT|nr:uncharacterized protein LOC111359616 [Spodoptera litura]
MYPRDKFYGGPDPFRRRHKPTRSPRTRTKSDKQKNDRGNTRTRTLRRKGVPKSGRIREQRVAIPHLISEQKSQVVLPIFNFSKYDVFGMTTETPSTPVTPIVTEKIEESKMEPSHLLSFKNFRLNFFYNLHFRM